MKNITKFFVVLFFSLFIVSCDSPAETKVKNENSNELSLKNPKTVGILANGQKLYMVTLNYYDGTNNRKHYVYYTNGGSSITKNSFSADKYRTNETEVTLSANATPDDILKAAEEIKANREKQKNNDMEEYLRLKEKLNIK